MAHAYVVADFGANEEAAQLARHRVEGWKQAFRLGNKILLKFDRSEGAAEASGKEAAKSGKKKDGEKGSGAGKIVVLIRLDFSDHEKLSFQRWLERIPKEELFQPAKNKIVRHGDADLAKIEARFESLD
ncbi:MAG TPA: hypothetical protein VEJ39_03930 [Candidatus Acidoferrales bacterium]|nr:hypothetical protein [Candidatus Acidoferrales bacterium]